MEKCPGRDRRGTPTTPSGEVRAASSDDAGNRVSVNGVEGPTGPGNRQTGAPSPAAEAARAAEAVGGLSGSGGRPSGRSTRSGRGRHRATDGAPRGDGAGQPADRASTPGTEVGSPAEVHGAVRGAGFARDRVPKAAGPGSLGRLAGKRASPAESLRGNDGRCERVETQANARRSTSGGSLRLIGRPRVGAPAPAGSTARGLSAFRARIRSSRAAGQLGPGPRGVGTRTAAAVTGLGARRRRGRSRVRASARQLAPCLLYTSDAADDSVLV